MAYAKAWRTFLLSKGANPNLGSGSAVVGAAAYYSIDVLKMLLDAGADPNKPTYASSSDGIRSMISAEKAKGAAANQANIKAWEGLLNNPAVKNAKPVEYFALRTAVYGTSCVPCVEALLAKGAKLDKGVVEGTMMHVFADSISPTPEEWKKNFAASKSTLEGLGMKLPAWYADVLSLDRIGTADQMLKLLLDKGLDINQKGKSTGGLPNVAPLEITLAQGLGKKAHVMLALINAGANVKYTHPTYGPLILQAAQTGLADVVKAMVEKGADINAHGGVWAKATAEMSMSTSFTPLTAAAAMNHTEVVRYLLGAGARWTDTVSGRANMKARNTGSTGGATVTCLFDLKDKQAMHFAIENDNLEMVKVLLENKAYIAQPYSLNAVHVGSSIMGAGAGCVGGGTFTASPWAKATHASPALIEYLQAQGI